MMGPDFPATLSRTGSYRLTSDLTVPNASTTGIVITAPSVTLDVNGYSIRAIPEYTPDSGVRSEGG